jgi:hypothetical protein
LLLLAVMDEFKREVDFEMQQEEIVSTWFPENSFA